MRSQLCGRSGLDVTGQKATSWSLSEETPTERMALGQLKTLKSDAFSLPKDSMLKASRFAAIAAAAAALAGAAPVVAEAEAAVEALTQPAVAAVAAAALALAAAITDDDAA